MSDNQLTEDKYKGLRLREFEWYEVETKIRSFVFELIDPQMKKLIKDRQKVDGFEDLLVESQQKINKLDMLVQNNENKMRQVDDLSKRLQNLEVEMSKMKIDFQQIESKRIEMNKAFEQQQTNMNGEIQQINNQIQQNTINMETQIKQVNSFKEEVRLSLDKSQTQQNIKNEETKQFISLSKESQNQLQDEFNLIKKLLQQKEVHIKQNTDNINLLEKRVVKNESEIGIISYKMQDIPILQQNQHQIKMQIDKQFKDISAINQYIQCNIPLNTYAQISECLYSCLSNENQKKLVDCDEKQFNVLNNRIINSNQPNPIIDEPYNVEYSKQILPTPVDFQDNNIFFAEKIANIVKRNKKYKKISQNKQQVMKYLKKDNTQQTQQTQQTSSNNLTPNGQEIIKGQLIDYENQISISNNLESYTNNQFSQAIQQNQQNNINSYNPQGYNNSLSSKTDRRENYGGQSKLGGGQSQTSGGEMKDDEILSVEEIIMKELSSPQFIFRLEEQIKSYAQQFEKQQINFINQIKSDFKELEEQNQIQLDKCFQMIEDEQQKVNTQRSNISHAFEAQNESLNTIQSCLEIFQDANNVFEQKISYLNQFCTIMNHLIFSDEKDKNTIGLFGLKENSIDQNQGNINPITQQEQIKGLQINQNKGGTIIHMDEKCISCSGQSVQLNQLFKLACLAYKPHPISIDGKQYSRIDLLKLGQNILSNINQQNFTTKQTQQSEKKIFKKTIPLEENNSKQMSYSDIQMSVTSKSIQIEPKTHRVQTANPINQTIDQGYLSHRNSLINPSSNQNLDSGINTQNSSIQAQNQKVNYYQIAETPHRTLKNSKETSNSSKECSQSQDDKIKRFSSVDSEQINLKQLNIAQLASSQMKIFTKHKVRKLVSNKQNQNSLQDINLNQTSINFSNSSNKQKVNSFEKRRQFIMRQSITSFNNSTIIN